MGFAPKDNIDRLLLNKYQKGQVDNVELSKNMTVPAKEVLNAMNDFADVQRTMLFVQAKLNDVCSELNSKSARYKSYSLKRRRA